MGDPLTFPFHDDEHEHESGRQRDDRFRAAHPDARYLVLDVTHAPDMATALADYALHPEDPWLTPVQENPVNAQVVAVLDQWPPATACRACALTSPEEVAALREEVTVLRALRTRGGPAPADTTAGWRNGASSQPATAHLPQNEVTA